MTRIRELFGTRTFSYRVFLTSVVTFLHQRASQKRFFQFFFLFSLVLTCATMFR